MSVDRCVLLALALGLDLEIGIAEGLHSVDVLLETDPQDRDVYSTCVSTIARGCNGCVS